MSRARWNARTAPFTHRATREALANAISHRDYTEGGGAVAVAMYDDRLEIGNPGALHFGLTPEKLFQPHESRPWNPIIAGVFYRAGIIEKWGTGTLNMLEWCREGHTPPPTYGEQVASVVVTFWPAEEFESRAGAEPGQPESPPESLAIRVLQLLAKGTLSKSEISRRLGQRAISRPLNDVIRALLAHGDIEQTIPERPQSRLQRYRLTDAGRERLARRTISSGEQR